MIENRDALIKYFAECGFKYGAEIGVAKGVFSKYMMDTIPDLDLLSVDAYVPSGGVSQRRRNSQYVEAKRALVKYAKNKLIFDTSLNVVSKIKEESLDFVYIDADHRFNSVMCDIIEWSKRVKKGGIVSGHDYTKRRTYGVVDAVDMYAKYNRVKVMLTGKDVHGVQSWYFVK